MKKVRLGDHLRFKRGTTLPGKYYSSSGKYIRLTLGNFDFKENCFKENTSKDNIYFTGNFKGKYLLDLGDIITPLTEQVRGLLGSTAKIPEKGKYILSQDVAKVESRDNQILLPYAYYLIPSVVVRKQLDMGSQQTKIRHTSVSKLEDLVAYIPPLDQQERIAEVLNGIDELCANLQSQITELEQTAQDLYDYWFIQFGFPDENGNPYRSSGGKMVWNDQLKQEIPAGWEVKSLYEIATFTNGLACQKHRPSEDDPGLPVIKIKEMTRGLSAETERVSSNIAKKYRIGLSDILFSWSATLLVKRWGAIRAGLNQHIFKVTPVEGISNGYIYLLLKHVVAEFSAIAMSRKTTMGHITQDHLRAKLVAVPPSLVSNAFESTYESLLDQWKVLTLQLMEWQTLNEMLMPLLMNGQATFKTSNIQQ
ncbi:restriction endonuclease subunit S [Corynebacterium kroppenstedtii]